MDLMDWRMVRYHNPAANYSLDLVLLGLLLERPGQDSSDLWLFGNIASRLVFQLLAFHVESYDALCFTRGKIP